MVDGREVNKRDIAGIWELKASSGYLEGRLFFDWNGPDHCVIIGAAWQKSGAGQSGKAQQAKANLAAKRIADHRKGTA